MIYVGGIYPHTIIEVSESLDSTYNEVILKLFMMRHV